MTAETLFSAANLVALAGWLTLAAGIFFQRPLFRDHIAGLAVPAVLSAFYAALVLTRWWGAEGGFGSLASVRQLFADDGLLLAGWVHYLAFDLFIGAALARRVMEAGLPRHVLLAILPLTFLFGPAGFLLTTIILFTRKGPAA